MENSEQFKNTLAEYVYQGGTVIVFGQQHGYEFLALPTPDGRPIVGYGWREDQSCQLRSIYIERFHPLLSSVSTFTVSASVDGYFVEYPEASIILLRRTKNGEPAMLAYPYGEGRVVVTSMYEDWGYAHWQSTAQGRSINPNPPSKK